MSQPTSCGDEERFSSQCGTVSQCQHDLDDDIHHFFMSIDQRVSRRAAAGKRPRSPAPVGGCSTDVLEEEGQTRKVDWGLILSPKLTILQGVGHPRTYIGGCYADDPKTKGYMPVLPSSAGSCNGDASGPSGTMLLCPEGRGELLTPSQLSRKVCAISHNLSARDSMTANPPHPPGRRLRFAMSMPSTAAD